MVKHSALHLLFMVVCICFELLCAELTSFAVLTLIAFAFTICIYNKMLQNASECHGGHAVKANGDLLEFCCNTLLHM